MYAGAWCTPAQRGRDRHISPGTAQSCARFVVSLLTGCAAALLLWVAPVSTAQAAEPDCTLPLPGAPCLLPTVHLSPRLEVVGTLDDRLLVYAHGPDGRARLQVYTAPPGGAPALLGSLEGDYGLPLPVGHYLYARAAPDGPVSVINLARPQSPAVVALVPLPAGVWTAGAGALFLATANGQMQVYNLATPTAPRLHQTVPLSGTLALAMSGARLVALTTDSVAIYPILATPELAAPRVIALSESLTGTAQLLAYGDYVYAMAASPAREPRCLVIRLSTAGIVGPCPMIAGKTTRLGTWAYVNPNTTVGEYQDYQIVSLSNASAPAVVGALPWRYRSAIPVGGLLYTSTFDLGLVRYAQYGSGALSPAPLHWNRESLGLEGSTEVLHNGVLYMDMGSQEGGRLIRRVNLASVQPQPLADLLSTSIGSRAWLPGERHLYAYSSDRLTIVDLATSAEVGRYDLPPGESNDLFTISPQGIAYLTTVSNLVVSVDLANPATPRQLDRLGLPSRTEQIAWAANHLYLFAANTLTIIPAPDSGIFGTIKQIPIEPDVRAVTATSRALVVLRSGVVQLLSLTNPATPLPIAANWGTGKVVRLLPAVGDRVAILWQGDEETGQSSTAMELRIHDLASGLPRLLSRIDTAGERDVLFDGNFVVFPDLTTVRIDGVNRVAGRLEGIATGQFSPRTGITYTIAPDTETAQSGASLCLEEMMDARGTGLPDGGLPTSPAGQPAARTALFTPRLFQCDTGEPVATFPLTVEVSAEFLAGNPGGWQFATPATNAGDGWQTPATGTDPDGRWRFVLQPGQSWAMVGPPPPPGYLPAILR